MAANQRHKSSGRKGQARPSRQPESHSVRSQARRYASDMREYASDMGEQMSDYVSRGASQMREVTRDHEGTAVLVALAAGFGVGILLGAAMASSHRQPLGWRDQIAAEGLGRRLMSRIEGMMPETLSEYVCSK